MTYPEMKEFLKNAKEAGDIVDYKIHLAEDGVNYDLQVTLKQPLELIKTTVVI